MIDQENLKQFLIPLYKSKDIMHDLSHIKRVIVTLNSLLEKVQVEVDYEATVLGTYFHGVVLTEEDKIVQWLKSNGYSEEKTRHILQIAHESQKSSRAESLEGKLVHDAHMIECGKAFLITKCLITGSLRGQTLEETIEYVERNIIGKGSCYTKEAQRIYNEAQAYAGELIEELKAGLSGNIFG